MTIPTVPTMRLVVNSQGPSLPHGSFEDLSSTLRQDHRQVVRKETLTKKGHESLQMEHNHFCETWNIIENPVRSVCKSVCQPLS